MRKVRFARLFPESGAGRIEVAGAYTRIREQRVTVDGPRFHEWMPAKSLYFADPDGHELELCAPVIESNLIES